MTTPALEFLPPLEAKLAGDAGLIEGYASTFGPPADSYGDVVDPAAFTKSLAEHKSADSMPAMLWSHSLAEPIGVWTSATEDSHGLKLHGRLALETQRGAEARALAQTGALALSIGFRTRDATYDKGRRILKDLDLLETSLVALPANRRAKLTSVKGIVDADEIRDEIAFEKFLKAHGFANSLARRLAAGWAAAVGRPGDDEAAELVGALKASAESFKSLGRR